MARLIINETDFAKLKNFSLQCRACNSFRVTIDVDWAAYPSASWCDIKIICEDCKREEYIYEG